MTANDDAFVARMAPVLERAADRLVTTAPPNVALAPAEPEHGPLDHGLPIATLAPGR